MNPMELADLCTPWCLHVVVTLRVAEAMEAGTQEIQALAKETGADAEALARVLRQLIAKGVFTEPARNVFALNDAARLLLAPEARIGLDLNGIGGRMAGTWSTLLSAVRTGRCQYQERFGRDFWEDLENNAALAKSFDDLMGPKGHGKPDWQILPDEADWKEIKTVVDVGGGGGWLLAEILKAQPQMRGTLVELPNQLNEASRVFEEAGVGERVTLAGQSFFDRLPKGADLYCLKKVLADWADEEALAILSRCAVAARPNGRVVVVGGVAAGDPDPELLMLVLVGGKSRSPEEFAKLAGGAGLAVEKSGENGEGRYAVVCRPL